MSFTAAVINPFVYDFKLYDEWMHPVGLYLLMDTLCANGIEVRFFDCLERSTSGAVKKYATGTFTSRELPKPDLFHNLKRKYKRYGCSPDTLRDFLAGQPRPDVVFVGSMMTYWANGVAATVHEVQTTLPEVPIVVGGAAARLMPEYFRKVLPNVTVFDGVLADGTELAVPGLPLRLRVPEEPSLREGFSRATTQCHGPALLSLGCPMSCSYCASGRLQPVYRRRSLATVTAELEMMVSDFGCRDIAFYDDALLVDAKRLLEPWLRGIVRNRYTIRLHTPNGLHLRYLDDSLLSLMFESGFTTLRFGYESGADRHRKQTTGKADATLLRKKLQLLRKYPFRDTGVYVMGGLPESGPEEMLHEMRLVASCGVAVKPVFISPVPGTPLFSRYALRYPQLHTDPNWHNDSFFITMLDGWGSSAVEEIRCCAKELNAEVRAH